MNETTCQQLKDQIAALAAGRFDVLTAEQVEVVAAHLAKCPSCAAGLAGAVPDPGTLRDPDSASRAPGDIEAQWARISQAVRPPLTSRPRRWARHLASLSAAAAVVLAVSAWQMWPRPESLWAMRLAGEGDIDIKSVEVHGDANLILMSLGEDNGSPIIWVTNGEDASS